MPRTETIPAPEFTRRRWLLSSGSALAVAACGGGDGAEPGTPTITAFRADRSRYRPGEAAVLSVSFSGGRGRIDPVVGEVISGQTVTTPPLLANRRFRLRVEATGRPSAEREIELAVGFEDRWLDVGQPFVCSHHAAVASGDGGVIVTGGSRGLSTLSEAVDHYDPATHRTTRIGGLRTGRSNHSALRLPGGQILVAGGVTSTSAAPYAELVDERSGAVADGGGMVRARSRHSATLLADGRVLVAGGLGHGSAELWDPETRRWRAVAQSMLQPRSHHSATLLADGRVLLAGGWSPVADYLHAEIFDPATETFAALQLPGAEWIGRRYLHGAHRLADGSVLLLGGELQGQETVPVNTTVRIDLAAARVAPAAPLQTPRTWQGGLLLPGDQVLLVGGQTDEWAASAHVALVGPGGQRALAPLPGPRVGHSTHRLADGRVLVIGGEDSAGQYVPQTLIYE